MAVEKSPQLSLNSGEIAQDAWGRIDLAKYRAGAIRVINFMPKVAGPAERRPGTGYVAPAKSFAASPRLLDFNFNDKQSYIIELGDLYARFYMQGGQLSLAGVPYEIVTPFLIADLFRLQVAQRADVMILAHGDYKTRALTRTAHTAWTCDPWQSDTGPFLDPNDTNIALTASARTGAITLSSSADLFTGDHVGALFRLEEDTSADYSMWEPAKSYALDALARFETNVYKVTHAGTSGAVAPTHLEGERFDGQLLTSVKWLYLHSGFGTCRITGFTNPQSVSAQVLVDLPSTNATLKWREGAFSVYRGFPAAVGNFGRRRYFGYTRTQPQTVWGSTVDAPDDFLPSSQPDGAVTFTIAGRTANPIVALSSGRALYIHTSRECWAITGTNGGPIKPGDIVDKRITSNGCNGVQPVDVDRALLMIDQSGKRLLEIGYQVEADEDAARDLTKFASHILKPGG